MRSVLLSLCCIALGIFAVSPTFAQWEDDLYNADDDWEYYYDEDDWGADDEDDWLDEYEEYALPDIDQYEWADSIDFLHYNDIVSGFPDGTYKPERTINRAEFVKIIVEATRDDVETSRRLVSTNPTCFPDVPVDAWFATYVCTAKQEGILDGYPDGTFGPERTINQAEALKIILEAFYDDILQSSGEWYQRYLDEAEFQGMFYFSPDSPGEHVLTRGEMAYFIAWILDDEGWDQIDPTEFGGEYAYEDDFGWEEMTEDDCYEDEYFDEEDQACYVYCDDEECEDDDEYFDEEAYDQLFGDLEFYHPDHESVEEAVIYSISGNTLTLQSDSSTSADLGTQEEHTAIWQRFTQLIPAAYRKDLLVEFHIFTDGQDGTMAFVDSKSEDGSTWILGVDIADVSNKPIEAQQELTLTLLHEFAHVLTLNNTQLDWSLYADECGAQYGNDEGCAEPNAYINLFFKKFWGGAIGKQHESIVAQYSDVEEGEEEASIALYEQHPTHFVSEYAASNPEEDIAEAFSYFVFKQKPEGNTVQDQKILFFYEIPQLLQLRKAIRQHL